MTVGSHSSFTGHSCGPPRTVRVRHHCRRRVMRSWDVFDRFFGFFGVDFFGFFNGYNRTTTHRIVMLAFIQWDLLDQRRAATALMQFRRVRESDWNLPQSQTGGHVDKADMTHLSSVASSGCRWNPSRGSWRWAESEEAMHGHLEEWVVVKIKEVVVETAPLYVSAGPAGYKVRQLTRIRCGDASTRTGRTRDGAWLPSALVLLTSPRTLGTYPYRDRYRSHSPVVPGLPIGMKHAKSPLTRLPVQGST